MHESVTSREPDGEANIELCRPGKRPTQLPPVLDHQEHALFHQVVKGRGEFQPPLPPCDVCTCV